MISADIFPAPERTAAAILLAAGESTRMGQPKQWLDWHGMPLLQYQIMQLCETSLQEIVVVLGHRAAESIPIVEEIGELPRVRAVINLDYRQGKTTSIKLGLNNLRWTANAVLLLAMDQPRPSQVLQHILDMHAYKSKLISIPSYMGKHGHPPVFDSSLVPELMAISEKRHGIREVIEKHRDQLQEIPLDSPVVRNDMNTPEDYRRAKATCN